jgi:predicted nucleotidyltransferase
MTRKELIEYIKANDHKYKYDGVTFRTYSDEDLLILKGKIDKENEKEQTKNYDQIRTL